MSALSALPTGPQRPRGRRARPGGCCPLAAAGGRPPRDRAVAICLPSGTSDVPIAAGAAIVAQHRPWADQVAAVIDAAPELRFAERVERACRVLADADASRRRVLLSSGVVPVARWDPDRRTVRPLNDSGRQQLADWLMLRGQSADWELRRQLRCGRLSPRRGGTLVHLRPADRRAHQDAGCP